MQKQNATSVCIIINTLLSGGAEKQSVLLAQILSKHYPTYLIILRPELIEDKFKDKIKGLNVIKLDGNYFNKGITLYRFLKQHKIKYIFSYLLSGNFYNGIIGGLANVPFRYGGIRASELSKKKVFLEKTLHNLLLHKTISNSYSAKEKLKLIGFNEEKFKVIHNGFDINIPAIKRKNCNIITILSVGRFVAAKDYFTALKAIELINEKYDNNKFLIKYVIVGYGNLEQDIREEIKNQKISDIVKIVINPPNIFDYYKNADIYLMTSLFEGMSNSVMEALSYSLPVVTTNAGDMEYLVKDDYNGYLCEFKNPKQVAEKLEIVIKDPNKRAKMGLNSYNLLKDNFSLEIFEKKYLHFIEGVTK